MADSNYTFAQDLATRLGDPISQWTEALASFGQGLRVAMPGIIVSFDEVEQTVVVRPALTDETVQVGVATTKTLPDLEDVPIVIPRAGIYSLTLPVAAGDECLMIFGDMDIGAWWDAGAANGKAQNQIHERRHTLADGFALLGISSQPRVLNDYSTTSAQLRTEDGTVIVDLAANQITVTAPTVQVNASSTAQVTAPTVNVSGSSAVSITGGHCSIDGKNFLLHTHTGVQTGGGTSGPVA